MRKLLLLLFFGIFFVSLASAIPTYKQSDTIPLTAVCDNCTQVNLTKVTYPNGSIALLGQLPMTKNGTNYNYSFSDTNTIGDYKYITCGDLDGILTCEDTEAREFRIKPLGLETSSGSSIIYAVLLILLIIFDLFIVYLVWAIEPGNYKTGDGDYIGISIKKYIRMILIGISYGLVLLTLNLAGVVASSLDSSQFYNIIMGLFQVMLRISLVWTFGIFIWIGITMWKDNQLVKEIRKRLEEGEWGV